MAMFRPKSPLGKIEAAIEREKRLHFRDPEPFGEPSPRAIPVEVRIFFDSPQEALDWAYNNSSHIPDRE